MFVDTHCHLKMMVTQNQDILLHETHFQGIAHIIQEAQAVGVGKLINIGTNLRDSKESIAIAQHFENVYTTVGIHPCDCWQLSPNDRKNAIYELRTLLKEKERDKIVAIGEVGLDFYHKPYDQQQQIDFFKEQIELALAYDLSIVIHVRDAADEILRVLEEFVPNKLRGVFHCFFQQPDFAKIILDWGFYVGLDAPITYPKNEWLRTMFKTIPLERIVLETDAPFLPPQCYRGQQNKPAHIPLIAQALVDLHDVGIDYVKQVTTANAHDLFVLKERS